MGERIAGDHISHLFDKDLEAIKHQVLKMGGLVEMQVENRTRRVYFIVFQNDEDSDFIQESAEIAQGIDAGAGITEKLCEMIALPD